MICYKDQTFCSSDCIRDTCFRFWGDTQKAGAKKWWKGMEGEAPVAFSDFTDTCTAYKAPTNEDDTTQEKVSRKH